MEELRSTLSKMPDAILRTLAREMEYEFESATATGRKIEFAKNVLSRLHPEDIVSIPSMAYRDGDISPLTSKAQKSNISALKKTGSVKTVRRYGYQNVADGVMVYVTDPSRIPLSNAHADNLAAGKSLAGALGFERVGYYTGEIRNINGKEIKTESRAIIGKDGTLYINLNADSPYTAIVGASWFENLRKTNTQTAAALVKAYDRYRKLTRSKADISQWIGKQLTGTQSTALFTGDKLFTEELANLMHMNASEILRVIEADPQFSSLIARGDMTLAEKTLDSIKRFFTRFGDTIARMTGNTDSRAASALTIAQKNLLIAMRDAPIDGARAIRTDEERAAEYRRIQRIEEEIERIDRLEAERERAAQKERADRRRDYYEELDRQEAEKKRARESRRKWNWGDVPDSEGGDLNSFMSRHVDNENGESYNQSRGDNNERDTNTGILESGKVPTADRNKNGLWERDKNSRYLAGLLGVAEDGEITAGLSGFLEGYNRDEGLSSGRLRQNTIRDLSAKRIRSTDTVGRKISESLQRKLAKTAIKAEDGTILSLYHWTNAVFDKFEKGDVGFHFGTFGASHAIMYDKSKPREKGYFKEAFLNVENPIIIEHDPSRWDVLSTAGKLSQMGVITPDEFNALASCSGFIRSEYGDEAVTELHVLLMQKGYDGVIYTNDFEGGYLLASLGVLRGRNKDDEDEFEKLRGAQEWSLVIGDVSYTIDWLAPMSLPLFVGVELYDQTANSNDKMDMQDILDSLTAISEPIFSLSMMDGVQSLLQSYSSEGAISDMFISALQSYAGQMTPTILGQLARTLDDTSRNAYYNDKTSWWSNTVMQPIRSAMAKIPGLEQQLPARVDAWGRTTEGTTSIGERFVQNFLSPGYWSVDKTTPVDEEIQKIYDATGDRDVLPDTAPKQFSYNGETYYLSSEEYVSFAVDRGQTAYAIIDELINNKTYKSLSAEDRAEAINKAYGIALDYAKGNTESGFNAESNKAIKAFNESGIEYSDYILFSVLCTGTSQADAYKALNKMHYLTDSERSAIWNTKGWKTSYADYKAEH